MYEIRNIEKVIEYVKKHESFLIFGTGKYGRKCLKILQDNRVFPAGFAVSPQYFTGG